MAVGGVSRDPLWAQFPANREIDWEFCNIGPIKSTRRSLHFSESKMVTAAKPDLPPKLNGNPLSGITEEKESSPVGAGRQSRSTAGYNGRLSSNMRNSPLNSVGGA
jgi:hypothetical protein